MIKKILLSFLLLTTSYASAQLFGPKNYEECVSDGKTGRTNAELAVHMDNCAVKFPSVPSIFKGNDKFVLCSFSSDKRFGFEIKASKKNNSATIKNFDNLGAGKVSIFNKEYVELIFEKSGKVKETILISISNYGNFTFRDNSGSYNGNCVEKN